MLILTTNSVAGYRVIRVESAVFSTRSSMLNIISDAFSKIRDFFGGRSSKYEQIFTKMQEEIISELQEQASLKNCNAIIGLRFDFDNIVTSKQSSIISCIGYGTPAYIEKIEEEDTGESQTKNNLFI